MPGCLFVCLAIPFHANLYTLLSVQILKPNCRYTPRVPSLPVHPPATTRTITDRTTTIFTADRPTSRTTTTRSSHTHRPWSSKPVPPYRRTSCPQVTSIRMQCPPSTMHTNRRCPWTIPRRPTANKIIIAARPHPTINCSRSRTVALTVVAAVDWLRPWAVMKINC